MVHNAYLILLLFIWLQRHILNYYDELLQLFCQILPSICFHHVTEFLVCNEKTIRNHFNNQINIYINEIDNLSYLVNTEVHAIITLI